MIINILFLAGKFRGSDSPCWCHTEALFQRAGMFSIHNTETCNLHHLKQEKLNTIDKSKYFATQNQILQLESIFYSSWCFILKFKTSKTPMNFSLCWPLDKASWRKGEFQISTKLPGQSYRSGHGEILTSDIDSMYMSFLYILILKIF